MADTSSSSNTTSSSADANQQQGNNAVQQMQQQQQMSNTNTTTTSPAMDFASILSKIQMLEKEKADMRAQLENANTRLSKLQVYPHSFFFTANQLLLDKKVIFCVSLKKLGIQESGDGANDEFHYYKVA